MKTCDTDFSNTSIYSMYFSCPFCRTKILSYQSGMTYILCQDCRAEILVTTDKSRNGLVINLKVEEKMNNQQALMNINKFVSQHIREEKRISPYAHKHMSQILKSYPDTDFVRQIQEKLDNAAVL